MPAVVVLSKSVFFGSPSFDPVLRDRVPLFLPLSPFHPDCPVFPPVELISSDRALNVFLRICFSTIFLFSLFGRLFYPYFKGGRSVAMVRIGSIFFFFEPWSPHVGLLRDRATFIAFFPSFHRWLLYFFCFTVYPVESPLRMRFRLFWTMSLDASALTYFLSVFCPRFFHLSSLLLGRWRWVALPLFFLAPSGAVRSFFPSFL